MFLTRFSARNTRLVEYYRSQGKADDDMVQSVLIQLYLNMSVVYMKNGFFDLARSVLQESI